MTVVRDKGRNSGVVGFAARSLVALLAVGVLAMGCGRGGSTASPDDAAPVFDDEHFTVGVATPDKIRPKRENVAFITVAPISPYHVNLDYKPKLTIDSVDDVELPASALEEAQRHDEDALVFAVPFTAKSEGTKRCSGELEFAVCETEECIPAKVPFEFELGVD